MTTLTRPPALLACGLLLTPLFVFASQSLALDKGCYACHGNPPRKNAPTFAQLAQDYAPYRTQAGSDIKLAEQLRRSHLFGGIQAHEQLSEQSALTLVRWLIEGAP